MQYLKQDADGNRVAVTQEEHMYDFIRCKANEYVKIIDTKLMRVYRISKAEPLPKNSPPPLVYGGRKQGGVAKQIWHGC